MKLLCKYLGGSHLYGTNTPESDIDYRGVFLNTDPLLIYGFNRLDNKTKQDSETDEVYHELSSFLKLSTKSNTQSLECLFAPRDVFEVLDPYFRDLVLNKRLSFLDTDSLFKSLRGYLFNEMRLALGERTGLLGSKRKNSLEKYGFSPKNFVHLIRLAECGRVFFDTGVYPVRVSEFNQELHDLLMDLKTNPGNFQKEDLVKLANQFQENMVASYEGLFEREKLKPDLEYVGYVLKFFYSNL